MNFPFKDVTDIAINSPLRQILVLQRSLPLVTVWDTNGTLLFSWNMTDLGYPHSITHWFQPGYGYSMDNRHGWAREDCNRLLWPLHQGILISWKIYQKHRELWKVHQWSSLNPLQFDRVTDLAQSPTSWLYYISDGDLGGLNNRVVVLNSDFKLVDVWNARNQPNYGPLQFYLPHAIKIDVCDRVWIADALHQQVQVITGDGGYIGQFKCFGNKIIYGLDFLQIPEMYFLFC